MASRRKHRTVKDTKKLGLLDEREGYGPVFVGVIEWSRRIPGQFATAAVRKGIRTAALERTPRGGTRSRWGVGILRLRECFASRSTHSAQDDKLLEALSDLLCLTSILSLISNP
jgi:hypothetical protein